MFSVAEVVLGRGRLGAAEAVKEIDGRHRKSVKEEAFCLRPVLLALAFDRPFHGLVRGPAAFLAAVPYPSSQRP